MFTIESSQLRAAIAEPGEHPNDTFRFARAGFITNVVLNNEIHFCANEPKNLVHPSSGGRGLCCEYNEDFSAGAAVGEYFPKLGIGLIRKEADEKYIFHKKYRELKPYPVAFTKTENSAEFVTEPVPCLGYAVREKRKISVEENRLTVEVELSNCGEKEFSTREYCHNFFSIDGMAISTDYHLELPNLPELGVRDIPNLYPNPCNFHADGNGVEILRDERATSLAKLPLDGMDETLPFRWRLSHKGAKASVSGEDYIKVSGVTLWEVDHIFSPEVFQVITLKPGEKTEWKRVLIFEAQA